MCIRDRSLALAGGKNGGKNGKKVEFESDLRAYGSVVEQEGGGNGAADEDASGCSALCTTGPKHRPHNCPLLKSGKAKVKQIKAAGVSILTSYGENPHYVKLPIFSEFIENSTKSMKNSDLTKWTQNLR